MSPIDLRLGRWQDVLADVECDALITDPPYSQRTEDGYRSGSDVRAQPGMGYQPITEDDAHAFIEAWDPRVRSWMVIFGDHISIRWFADAMESVDRYVFPPLPIVKVGAPPRMSGDGPASQAEMLVVSRPREGRFMDWGSLPGWYRMQTVRAGHETHGVRGAKSLDLMRALVRDYSRAGDLVCDPHAGSATTLVAAVTEGRRATGAEWLLAHYDIGRKRIARGYTPLLFGEGT